MDDRCLMESILLLEKGACDLYMHGTLESSTSNIHQTFDCALDNSLKLQSSIYNEMSAKGWYPAEQAEQKKVNQLKQKFSEKAM